MTLADEVKAIQMSHLGWSFQEAWDHLMAEKPELSSKSSAHNRLIARDAQQKEENFARIEAIARNLMRKDPKLTFSCALEIVRAALPGVQADIKAMLGR